jgi:hypothetical protein
MIDFYLMPRTSSMIRYKAHIGPEELFSGHVFPTGNKRIHNILTWNSSLTLEGTYEAFKELQGIAKEYARTTACTVQLREPGTQSLPWPQEFKFATQMEELKQALADPNFLYMNYHGRGDEVLSVSRRRSGTGLSLDSLKMPSSGIVGWMLKTNAAQPPVNADVVAAELQIFLRQPYKYGKELTRSEDASSQG